MRPSVSRLASSMGLVMLLLAAGCGGIERGYNTANTDGGAGKDLAGGSCVNCSGMCCLNKCTDTKTDAQNCGACGKPCAAGMTCIGGICQCAGPGGQGAATCAKDEACCSGKCVSVMSDDVNCGACGKDCTAAMETCLMGQCGCGSPGAHCMPNETCCDTSCLDLQVEETDCGACGSACAQGQTCEAGVCVGGGGGMQCGAMMCKQGEMCFQGMICIPVGGGGMCNPPCMAPKICLPILNMCFP